MRQKEREREELHELKREQHEQVVAETEMEAQVLEGKNPNKRKENKTKKNE